MSAAVSATAAEARRLVPFAEVRRVLTEEVGEEVAAHVSDVLAEVPTLDPEADDPAELELADTLNRTLYELNRMNHPQHSGDNSWEVRTGRAVELNVYAHVQAALMQVLERLAGTKDRADELRGHLIDCVDEGAAYVLAQVRPEWAHEDAEKALEQHPTAVLVRRLLDEQPDSRAYEAMVAQLVAAGAMWWCGECDWHTVSVADTCGNCASPRPEQADRPAA
ncbi:hypothetical protein [Saccharothrix sp. HUAS TT1]|uniref:hypothetical protein n=1 Tax=unclassified Saccharothrix TaxID=2593673 RepID=UPI00345BD006